MNKQYSKSVELSMTAGLEVLRSVSALLNMESHVSDCQSKMKDSRSLVATDEEVHDIIVEMMMTVVRRVKNTVSHHLNSTLLSLYVSQYTTPYLA